MRASCRTLQNDLEVVTQTHQVHVAQVVGAGGEHVFVIHAEAVIQLEADTHAVVDALVVTAVHVLNTVTHEVRLDGFDRVLTDWELVARKVFNTPCITAK